MLPAGRSSPTSGNHAAADASNPHAAPADILVVERARSGDATAWSELVDRHAPRLHAMLVHLVDGDREHAAELVQEAFVRAFANLDRFAGRSAFYTWLYRLARNRALDLLARKRARTGDDAALDGPAPGCSPLDRIGDEELRERVRIALRALPPEQRELLVLREYDGLDYQQLAEALDVPEGTVKSRLNRARAALRAQLAASISAEDLS